ncbi:MAG: SpoVA/SpoVAEb family sporulation membrane protein [Firmicutes bacterium]|nr:SpoVA/SpoVAEb family sporulation membrane protein [Bacillota bacterium]
MNYIYAFLFAGLVCAIGQIILDNTKLTPGHITSSFTVIGAFLSFLGFYDDLIKMFGAGATTLISNFGHMLYSSAMEGFTKEGLIGIFSGMLVKSSLAISAVIVFSFIFALIFKPKD